MLFFKSRKLSKVIKKPCSKCNTLKSLTDFYPDKKGKLGRKSQCISCQSEQKRVKNPYRGFNTPRGAPKKAVVAPKRKKTIKIISKEIERPTEAVKVPIIAEYTIDETSMLIRQVGEKGHIVLTRKTDGRFILQLFTAADRKTWKGTDLLKLLKDASV